MPAQSLQSYDQGVMRLLQNVQTLGSMIETLTQKVDRVEENIGLKDPVQNRQEQTQPEYATAQEETQPQVTASQTIAPEFEKHTEAADQNQAALDAIKNIDVSELGNFNPAATDNQKAESAANDIDIDALLDSVNMPEESNGQSV